MTKGQIIKKLFIYKTNLLSIDLKTVGDIKENIKRTCNWCESGVGIQLQ